MESKQKRVIWIDYLKVFACILVIIGHLIQSLQKSSIDNHTDITSFINWFIYLFHMPLFFTISGYLYRIKEKKFSWKQYKSFILKKVMNLGIPYLVFYLLYVIINMIFADSVNSLKGMEEIIGIVNNPMPPYWFLYALLSIFILVPLVEKLLKNRKNIIFAVLIVLKVLSIFINTKIYLIDSFCQNAIYFYLGSMLTNVNSILNRRQIARNIIKKVLFIITYIIVAIIYYVFFRKINVYISAIIRVAFAICGILICINIFKNIEHCKVFEYIKNYTFQIYLLHTIFAAGFRILLIKFGIYNYLIHFVVGLLASIIFPIIIAKICKKTKYLNFFFYPLKTIEEIKNKKVKE